MALPYMAIPPLSVSVVCVVEHNEVHAVEAGATAHYVTVCVGFLLSQGHRVSG